jgi:hypothetical protein
LGYLSFFNLVVAALYIVYLFRTAIVCAVSPTYIRPAVWQIALMDQDIRDTVVREISVVDGKGLTGVMLRAIFACSSDFEVRQV